MEIVKALSITLKGDVLTTISDSMYAIQRIIENLRKWGDEGWMRVQNADIFQKIAYELDTRGGEHTSNGSNNNPGNYGADEKANKGAQKENADSIELKVPKGNINSREQD